MHLFHKYASKFGGVVWVGGVVKVVGRGGFVKLHDLILPKTKQKHKQNKQTNKNKNKTKQNKTKNQTKTKTKAK